MAPHIFGRPAALSSNKIVAGNADVLRFISRGFVGHGEIYTLPPRGERRARARARARVRVRAKRSRVRNICLLDVITTTRHKLVSLTVSKLADKQ